MEEEEPGGQMRTEEKRRGSRRRGGTRMEEEEGEGKGEEGQGLVRTSDHQDGHEARDKRGAAHIADEHRPCLTPSQALEEAPSSPPKGGVEIQQHA